MCFSFFSITLLTLCIFVLKMFKWPLKMQQIREMQAEKCYRLLCYKSMCANCYAMALTMFLSFKESLKSPLEPNTNRQGKSGWGQYNLKMILHWALYEGRNSERQTNQKKQTEFPLITPPFLLLYTLSPCPRPLIWSFHPIKVAHSCHTQMWTLNPIQAWEREREKMRE